MRWDSSVMLEIRGGNSVSNWNIRYTVIISIINEVVTCHLSELSLPELPDVGDPLDGVAEHEHEDDHEADVGQLHLPPVHEPACTRWIT